MRKCKREGIKDTFQYYLYPQKFPVPRNEGKRENMGEKETKMKTEEKENVKNGKWEKKRERAEKKGENTTRRK